MEHALKAGATPDELLQVVLLTTVLSAHHPIDLGLAILGVWRPAASCKAMPLIRARRSTPASPQATTPTATRSGPRARCRGWTRS
ncbi:hypothetical protein [Mesorhizobium sp. J428]|uniref:hypothetical protein n=1 Tax=Mesorhizobium sp. J428 TaxID=2898440 RepID=UPI0021513E26|nr:hypothetical protein [Mesorhizobium sp. J428]MCR5859919.1 hypothetical protein [Mesorhizobium sp. J428]